MSCPLPQLSLRCASDMLAFHRRRGLMKIRTLPEIIHWDETLILVRVLAINIHIPNIFLSNQIHITLPSFGTSSTEISEYCFHRLTKKLYALSTKLFLWQVVSYWVFSWCNIWKILSGFYDKIGPRSVQMTLYLRLYAEARTEYSWEHPSVNIYSIRASCVFLTAFTVGQDPDWLALTLKFSKDVVISGRIISLFPGFLQPWIFLSLLSGDRY